MPGHTQRCRNGHSDKPQRDVASCHYYPRYMKKSEAVEILAFTLNFNSLALSSQCFLHLVCVCVCTRTRVLNVHIHVHACVKSFVDMKCYTSTTAIANIVLVYEFGSLDGVCCSLSFGGSSSSFDIDGGNSVCHKKRKSQKWQVCWVCRVGYLDHE
jgi:hypothetical protein